MGTDREASIYSFIREKVSWFYKVDLICMANVTETETQIVNLVILFNQSFINFYTFVHYFIHI